MIEKSSNHLTYKQVEESVISNKVSKYSNDK